MHGSKSVTFGPGFGGEEKKLVGVGEEFGHLNDCKWKLVDHSGCYYLNGQSRTTLFESLLLCVNWINAMQSKVNARSMVRISCV